MPRQPQHRLRREQDAHDKGAPLDVLVQTFERIRALWLVLVLDGKMPMRDDVFIGFPDQRGRSGCPKTNRRLSGVG